MICNPKGIRTKRHHAFFGLVEDSIPPLLTSDHVTIPIFGIPTTVAQSRGLVTIRARHPEKSPVPAHVPLEAAAQSLYTLVSVPKLECKVTGARPAISHMQELSIDSIDSRQFGSSAVEEQEGPFLG